MAPLNRPESKIPGLIFAAYEAKANDWDGLGFSMSDLGSECDRYLWYALRWAFPKEVIQGRQHRLFETGNREEDRVVANLRMIGMEVEEVDPDTGKQFIARALAGHVRGKLDGIIYSGVPESPAKPHVLEIKTHGHKSFTRLKSMLVEKAKPDHYAQMNVYMGVTGIDRAIYFAVSKNDDDIHVERIKFDHEAYTRLLARLQRIAQSNAPAPPLNDKRDAPDCRFCKAKDLCIGAVFPRNSCRTCLHSTPEMFGDAAWSCARHVKPLLADEQRAGCANHLFIPALVPGEQIDVDEAAETVTYRLPGGLIWVDGQDNIPTPQEETA